MDPVCLSSTSNCASSHFSDSKRLVINRSWRNVTNPRSNREFEQFISVTTQAEPAPPPRSTGFVDAHAVVVIHGAAAHVRVALIDGGVDRRALLRVARPPVPSRLQRRRAGRDRSRRRPQRTTLGPLPTRTSSPVSICRGAASSGWMTSVGAPARCCWSGTLAKIEFRNQ
jgi:hypothetical protein